MQNWIAAFYDGVMKLIVQIQEKFGSIFNMIERTGVRTIANSYTEEEQQAFETVFQWLVQDYNVMHITQVILILLVYYLNNVIF